MIPRLIYLLAAIGLLLSLDILWHISMVHVICKALLMPALIVLVFMRGWRSTPRKLLVAGLFLSWLGDLALINAEEEQYFLLGLSAFLLAHITYIFSFRKARDTNHEIVMTTRLPLFIFLFLGIAIGMFLYLRPDLGQMEIPVLLYSLVIMVMALQALNRFKKTSGDSFRYVFGGALLFMLSDSLLAMNKFKDEMEYGTYFVLATYILAQWFIAQGILKHQD
ncbi:MAG: lysoplasmalogenase [Flavobacteriales bacterium]|nr:lysoplasmalogenase [Flavobacteriales bacterium]